MVIELSGVYFVLTSKLKERAAPVRLEFTSMIFRPKLHDPKFNYHIIRSILPNNAFLVTDNGKYDPDDLSLIYLFFLGFNNF